MVQDKTAGEEGVTITEVKQDGIQILDNIRLICHQKDGSKQGILKVVNLECSLYLCVERDGQSNTDYLRAFKGIIEISGSI